MFASVHNTFLYFLLDTHTNSHWRHLFSVSVKKIKTAIDVHHLHLSFTFSSRSFFSWVVISGVFISVFPFLSASSLYDVSLTLSRLGFGLRCLFLFPWAFHEKVAFLFVSLFLSSFWVFLLFFTWNCKIYPI